MGLGFRLPLKWGFPVQSHFVTNSPSMIYSCSEGDTLCKDPLKICAYSSATQTLENYFTHSEGVKVNVGYRSHVGPKNIINNSKMLAEEEDFISQASFRVSGTSHFSLLLENLNVLEESFEDSDALMLESDILLQLGRLGALKLFNTRLSTALKTLNVLDLSDVPTENMEECKTNDASNGQLGKIIVCSGKKEERRCRRERVSKYGCKAASWVLPSKTIQNAAGKPSSFSSKKASNSKRRRLVIARNEAEMSKGVKMVSNLERIRTTLEEGTGQLASLSCWAEAAGLDKKVLQQHLRFGWYCKNELIRSTRSLVLYIARSYRGFGIPLEDLLQAGNMGVLQGAERFDHTRGYRFSTYVQYWIRKSMSKTVELHARGIKIPCTLSLAMNKIRRARKTFSCKHGRYPDDDEIAKFTGLSLDKIKSARQCHRVVGSIDQKVGDCHNAKHLEFIPDMSIQNPEEAVMRQHMKSDIHHLLRGLDSKERQVLAMRYGFKDHQPKSLEEIGRVFKVSKEWVRRMEKKVMTRLADEETRRILSHYTKL